MSRLKARDLLGAEGPFASKVEGYQVRSGQQDVAEAVERLLDRDGSLICEAGTGIGKTFAYLIPALLSGRKVVISTATKNLQEQIAHRDLPLVQRVLGTDARVAVMKGLNNYLCRRRHKEFLLSSEAIRPKYAGSLRLLRDWSSKSEMGDFSELSTLSESASVRNHVGASSETRLGTRCPYYDECFVTNMKRDAEAAQIIIVNHHLFFADLALRGPHPGRVIADYDVAIVDEAHQMEDVAALFFGVRLTDSQLSRAIREAARFFSRVSKSADASGDSPTIVQAQKATVAFFQGIDPQAAPGRRVLTQDVLTDRCRSLVADLDGALSDLGAAARSRSDQVHDDLALREGLEHTARRMDNLRECLEKLCSEQKGSVLWTERAGGKVSLSSTPVDLSWTLKERLFESVPAVALLSATFSTNSKGDKKGFSFVRSRLGLLADDAVEELAVPSPFSYAQQCALYLPTDLPPPGSKEFLDQSADRIAELVEFIDGGAFVLTTSLSAMRGLHERLKQKISARLLLVQGERPKDALLSAFRANGAAVLVATSSFWEGVDVPGKALRLVVLEKIPFSVPSDPIFQARGRALEEAGMSSFAHLALPDAALALKQGFGRLIRREDDVGVVALLDERVHTKGYGKKILNVLPNAYRTSELQDLRAFVQSWPPSQERQEEQP